MSNQAATGLPIIDLVGDSSDTESTNTWESDSDFSTDDEESDLDTDFVPVDAAFLEEDRAMDKWMAKFPGGSRLLYPQVFIVEPQNGKGKIVSQRLDPSLPAPFLALPPEIRNRIYEEYFNYDYLAKYPLEEHAPFRNREGREMQRVHISSTDDELKYWLSNPLFWASRELRADAMFVFLSTRVLTIDWIFVLPRLVSFLGKRGCSMVRFLDVWDSLNLQEDQSEMYEELIASIADFPKLQHLRIVLTRGIPFKGPNNKRYESWYKTADRERDGTLRPNAKPVIEHQSPDNKFWPELATLKTLKAGLFTLAVDKFVNSGADNVIVEFDRTRGAYPEISEAMKNNMSTTPFTPTSLQSSLHSIRSEDAEVYEPSWQVTDTQASKSLLVFNWLRKLYQDNSAVPTDDEPDEDFACFPTALASTGSITRDCPFCYLQMNHCGYHSVPDQPPYVRQGQLEEGTEAAVLASVFREMSYVEMRGACREIVNWLIAEREADLCRIFCLFNHFDRHESPNEDILAQLDTTTELGWTGKSVDKSEITPWDVLFRELCHDYPEAR